MVRIPNQGFALRFSALLWLFCKRYGLGLRKVWFYDAKRAVSQSKTARLVFS